MVVEADGRIGFVGPWQAGIDEPGAPDLGPLIDLRPWLILPGLVDLHVHLPQVPHAGLGFGTPLLDWLRRYVFPLEHDFTEAVAEVVAPAVFRAFAAAGTTTALMYGAVYEPSLDAAFRAAEAHGIRAIIGKVMMDRLTYDETRRPSEVLDLSLRQSADLCARWHMRDKGRLRYAFTPRFAVSCSAEMLRESAALAAAKGAYWQTHLAEDRAEIAEVARLFPEARDYLDVYDRAGGLGPRTILAHAIHLSEREVARLAESGRGSPTARPRTCSWRRGSCPSAATSRQGSPSAWARTWPAARTCRCSGRCGSAAMSRTRCAWRPAIRGRSSTRSAGCGWPRSRAPAAWAWRTRSARSRRARKPT